MLQILWYPQFKARGRNPKNARQDNDKYTKYFLVWNKERGGNNHKHGQKLNVYYIIFIANYAEQYYDKVHKEVVVYWNILYW